MDEVTKELLKLASEINLEEEITVGLEMKGMPQRMMMMKDG